MSGIDLTAILRCIIDQMALAGDDWQMPWHGRHSPPLNAGTGRAYRGVNRLILWAKAQEKSFQSSYWATFNQWRKQRQPVQKGQRGTALILPIIEPKPEGDEELKGFRTFYVFNGDQVLNRDETHPDLFGHPSIECPDVDEFVDETGARIVTGGNIAAYYRDQDLIRMPPRDAFFRTRTSTREQTYYSTLLHELIHWTGHPSRQGRHGPFEDSRENYAFEELVAELGAAFLCSEFGIADVPRKDHAQYLNHWLQFLQEKPANLWRASALAQRAVSSLLDHPEEEPEADDSTPSWFQAQPVQIDLLAPMALKTS